MLDDQLLHDLDHYLSSLEQTHDTTIPAAWVVGSHAMGLASSESDIDINFIFADYESVLHDTTHLDATEAELAPGVPSPARHPDRDIEFSGWHVRRFLDLLADRDEGNNPSAIETLASPLTLRTHPAIDDIAAHVNDHFNVIELHRHYQSFAKNNYRRYIESGQEPTVKRTLHVIRACLNGAYIRHTHEFPPLDVPTLLDTAPESVLADWDRDHLDDVIEAKQRGRGDDELDNLFADQIEAFIDYDLDHRAHVRDQHLDHDTLGTYLLDVLDDTL